MRCVSTRVLPDPAPATMSSAGPRYSTASRCGGLSPRGGRHRGAAHRRKRRTEGLIAADDERNGGVGHIPTSLRAGADMAGWGSGGPSHPPWCSKRLVGDATRRDLSRDTRRGTGPASHLRQSAQEPPDPGALCRPHGTAHPPVVRWTGAHGPQHHLADPVGILAVPRAQSPPASSSASSSSRSRGASRRPHRRLRALALGRTVVQKSTSGAWSFIGNVIWVILAGWWSRPRPHRLRHPPVHHDHRHPDGIADFETIPVLLAPLGKDIVSTRQGDFDRTPPADSRASKRARARTTLRAGCLPPAATAEPAPAPRPAALPRTPRRTWPASAGISRYVVIPRIRARPHWQQPSWSFHTVSRALEPDEPDHDRRHRQSRPDGRQHRPGRPPRAHTRRERPSRRDEDPRRTARTRSRCTRAAAPAPSKKPNQYPPGPLNDSATSVTTHAAARPPRRQPR